MYTPIAWKCYSLRSYIQLDTGFYGNPFGNSLLGIDRQIINAKLFKIFIIFYNILIFFAQRKSDISYYDETKS